MHTGWMVSSFIALVIRYSLHLRVCLVHCVKWFFELRAWRCSAEGGGAMPTAKDLNLRLDPTTSWPLEKGGANRLQKGGARFLLLRYHEQQRRWTHSLLRFCPRQCQYLHPSSSRRSRPR
jgi:hypothetical protein